MFKPNPPSTPEEVKAYNDYINAKKGGQTTVATRKRNKSGRKSSAKTVPVSTPVKKEPKKRKYPDHYYQTVNGCEDTKKKCDEEIRLAREAIKKARKLKKKQKTRVVLLPEKRTELLRENAKRLAQYRFKKRVVKEDPREDNVANEQEVHTVQADDE